MGNKTYLLSVAPPSHFRRYALAYSVAEQFEVHTYYPLTAPLWRTLLGFIHRDEMKTGRRVISGTAKLVFMLEGEVGVKDALTPDLPRAATLKEVIRDFLISRYQSGKSIDYVAHQIEKVISSSFVARNTEIARFARPDIKVADVANFLLLSAHDAGLLNGEEFAPMAKAESIQDVNIEWLRRSPKVKIFETADIEKILVGPHDRFAYHWDAAAPTKLLNNQDVYHISDHIMLVNGLSSHLRTPLDAEVLQTTKDSPEVVHVVDNEHLILYKLVKDFEDVENQTLVANRIEFIRDSAVQALAPGTDPKSVVQAEVDALTGVFSTKEWYADYIYLVSNRNEADIPEAAQPEHLRTVDKSVLRHEVEVEKLRAVQKYTKIESYIIDTLADAYQDPSLRELDMIQTWSAELKKSATEAINISPADGQVLKTLFGEQADQLLKAVRDDAIPDAAVVGTVSSYVFNQLNAEIVQPVKAAVEKLVANALIQSSVSAAVGNSLKGEMIEDIVDGLLNSKLEGIRIATENGHRDSIVIESVKERLEGADREGLFLNAFKHLTDTGVIQERISEAVKHVTERADDGIKIFDSVINQIEQASLDLVAQALIESREGAVLSEVVWECVAAITEKAKYSDVPYDSTMTKTEWANIDIEAMVFEAIAHTVEKSKVDKLYETVYNLIEGAKYDTNIFDTFLHLPEGGIEPTVVKDTDVAKPEWASYQSLYDTFQPLIEKATVNVQYDAEVGPRIEKAVFNAIVGSVIEHIEHGITDSTLNAFVHQVEGATHEMLEEAVIHETETADRAVMLEGTIEHGEQAWYQRWIDSVVHIGEAASKIRQRVRASIDEGDEAVKQKSRVKASITETEEAARLKKRHKADLEEGVSADRVKKRLPTVIEKDDTGVGIPDQPKVEKRKGWVINGKPFSWSFWPWSKKR